MEGCFESADNRDGSGHQFPRVFGVLLEELQDHGCRDVFVVVMPTVVVSDHRYCGIGDLCFPGQLGFGHVGHTDEVGAPGAVHIRFGARRKLEAVHDDVSTPADDVNARDDLADHFDRVAHRAADWIGHADVSDEAIAEKRAFASAGFIDVLVDDYKPAG